MRVCADADHEVCANSLPIPVSQLEIRLFQFPRGGQAWMLEIRGACRPSLQVLHGLPEVIEKMVRCSHQLLSDNLYARFFHRLELEGMAAIKQTVFYEKIDSCATQPLVSARTNKRHHHHGGNGCHQAACAQAHVRVRFHDVCICFHLAPVPRVVWFDLI